MLESAIRAHGTKRCLHLKGFLLSFASEESTRKFLCKIYAIVETRKLSKQIISSKYFVAVLGREDVGKTSFILVSITIVLAFDLRRFVGIFYCFERFGCCQSLFMQE